VRRVIDSDPINVVVTGHPDDDPLQPGLRPQPRTGIGH
jgi:hypothetical protein